MDYLMAALIIAVRQYAARNPGTKWDGIADHTDEQLEFVIRDATFIDVAVRRVEKSLEKANG